ncbi:DNA-binding protein [Candidatus Pacearchaeota archaeon]|nr:DNA-binding protein [Candidatus Pacearchaeota archaeon]
MIREAVYTITEAAGELGVERHTIRRWIDSGKLPAETVGRVVLIPRWAVKNLQEQRKAPR